MNYEKIINADTLNGKGFRVSLFVSGCGKIPKCKFCHNQIAWDFKSGFLFTEEEEEAIIRLCSQAYIDGLSLLGGEPTDNLEDGTLFRLLDRFKREVPNKTVWLWSGYTFEEIIKNPIKKKFLHYIDVLVDGEYDYTKKNLNNAFRNSENQRMIDVQASLKEDKVILYNLSN